MVDRSSKALFFELSQMLKDSCTVSPIILSCTVAVAVRGSCVAQSYVAELSIRASCISSAPSGQLARLDVLVSRHRSTRSHRTSATTCLRNQCAIVSDARSWHFVKMPSTGISWTSAHSQKSQDHSELARVVARVERPLQDVTAAEATWRRPSATAPCMCALHNNPQRARADIRILVQVGGCAGVPARHDATRPGQPDNQKRLR